MLKIAEKSEDLKELMSNYRDPSYGIYNPMEEEDMADEKFLTLSNVHQIKGKGFTVVFFLGCPDEKFEWLEIFDDDDLIVDELMIMNVALTRSARYLYFLFPMILKDWKEKVHKRNPSIFIRNCPEKLYDCYTVKYEWQ